MQISWGWNIKKVTWMVLRVKFEGKLSKYLEREKISPEWSWGWGMQWGCLQHCRQQRAPCQILEYSNIQISHVKYQNILISVLWRISKIKKKKNYIRILEVWNIIMLKHFVENRNISGRGPSAIELYSFQVLDKMKFLDENFASPAHCMS